MMNDEHVFPALLVEAGCGASLCDLARGVILREAMDLVEWRALRSLATSGLQTPRPTPRFED
jgi:hypothetical protein